MRDADRLDWLPAEHVWTPDELHRDLLLRVGVITTSFANVDFLASVIAVQASLVYPVKDWAPRYPATLGSRLKFWRQILNRPGPLRAYARLGESLLRRYQQLGECRHMVAHSSMRPVANEMVRFERMLAERDAPATHRVRNMTFDAFRLEARRAAAFSRRCTRLAEALRASALLPPLEGIR